MAVDPARSRLTGISSCIVISRSVARKIVLSSVDSMRTHPRIGSVDRVGVSTRAEFVKKATGVTTFTCSDWHEFDSAANAAIATNEPQTATGRSAGLNSAGENIANFEFTWSFKKQEQI